MSYLTYFVELRRPRQRMARNNFRDVTKNEQLSCLLHRLRFRLQEQHSCRWKTGRKPQLLLFIALPLSPYSRFQSIWFEIWGRWSVFEICKRVVGPKSLTDGGT